MLVYVIATKNHRDEVAEGRPTRYKGEIYETPLDSAERKERVGHAEIIGPVESTDLQEARKEYQPDIETRVPDVPETKPEEFDTERTPEDIISQTTEGSPWYNIEGYDDNPVQGRDNALEVAQDVLNN